MTFADSTAVGNTGNAWQFGPCYFAPWPLWSGGPAAQKTTVQHKMSEVLVKSRVWIHSELVKAAQIYLHELLGAKMNFMP